VSGYRAPALPVAALVTRYRAGAMAFLADRFREYAATDEDFASIRDDPRFPA